MCSELVDHLPNLVFAIFLYFVQNVLVDGSLRDFKWYQEYFKRLRNEFPFLRLAILHVTAPREAVFDRAAVSAGKISLDAATHCIAKQISSNTSFDSSFCFTLNSHAPN